MLYIRAFAKALPHYATADCVVQQSGNICISTFSLSVMPAFMQNSGMNGKKTPFRSSMNSQPFIFVFDGPANNSLNMVRTETSFSGGSLYSLLVMRRDSMSAVWRFTTGWYTVSNSNSDSLKRHRASSTVASAVVRNNHIASWSVRILKHVLSHYLHRSMTAHITGWHCLCNLSRFFPRHLLSEIRDE